MKHSLGFSNCKAMFIFIIIDGLKANYCKLYFYPNQLFLNFVINVVIIVDSSYNIDVNFFKLIINVLMFAYVSLDQRD